MSVTAHNNYTRAQSEGQRPQNCHVGSGSSNPLDVLFGIRDSGRSLMDTVQDFVKDPASGLSNLWDTALNGWQRTLTEARDPNTWSLGNWQRAWNEVRGGASLGLDLIPVIGDIKGVIEGLVGYDLAGNKLSKFEQSVAIAGALLGMFTIADELIDAGKLLRHVANNSDFAGDLVKARRGLSHVDELAGTAGLGRYADEALDAATSTRLRNLDGFTGGSPATRSADEVRASLRNPSGQGALSRRLNRTDNSPSAGSVDNGVVCARNSFTAETPVHTDEGQKPIEEIEVGDKVLSEDPETGEQGYFEVVAITSHAVDEVLHVTLDVEAEDSDNDLRQQLNSDTMEVTPEHPVYVEGKGWLWAENLSIGDRLRRADGGMAKVLAIERRELDEPQMVYNFTVKGPHTYFVLEAGVLVHNAGVCKWSPDAKRWYQEGRRGAVAHEQIPLEVVQQASNQAQLFWIKNKLKNGNVDDVLHRFGIDSNAEWVQKTGLKEDLLKIGKSFKDKDVAPYGALAEAIDDVLPPGWTFGARSIPEGSHKYWGFLSPKPRGAKNKLKSPNGVRIVEDKQGNLQLVVSDLDGAIVLDETGRAISSKKYDETFLDNNQFNEAFADRVGIDGARMMDHPDQFSGMVERYPGVPHKLGLENIFVKKQGQQDYTEVWFPQFVEERVNFDDNVRHYFSLIEMWR